MMLMLSRCLNAVIGLFVHLGEWEIQIGSADADTPRFTHDFQFLKRHPVDEIFHAFSEVFLVGRPLDHAPSATIADVLKILRAPTGCTCRWVFVDFAHLLHPPSQDYLLFAYNLITFDRVSTPMSMLFENLNHLVGVRFVGVDDQVAVLNRFPF